MADDKKQADLYSATYMGSGTFRIKKPKRRASKTHLARVHDTRRRARRH